MITYKQLGEQDGCLLTAQFRKEKRIGPQKKSTLEEFLFPTFLDYFMDSQRDFSYQCLRTLGMAVYDLSKSSCGCVELEGQGLHGYSIYDNSQNHFFFKRRTISIQLFTQKSMTAALLGM